MKIVADDRIPFLRGVFEPWCEVCYCAGAKITAETVRDADALIVRTRTRCDRALLAGSRVRAVATATIGFDHVDAAVLAELGIVWSSAPGCNSSSVAQYLASALLLLPGTLRGRTLGVVGVGHVGRKVAAVGETLGMRVLLNDPPRAEREGAGAFVSLDEIAAESDVVTFHVPLERGGRYPTFHLADDGFFAKMRSGAVFINASRGAAVDTAAVLAALRSGRLGCAGFDVWENEPAIDSELLERSSFGTPHVAGYSTDGKANGTTAAVRFIATALGIGELASWSPAALPAPSAAPEIVLDAALPVREQLRLAVHHSYDVRRDSAALKNAPESFEELRGGYPVRREFPFFEIVGGTPEAREILVKLGFRPGRA